MRRELRRAGRDSCPVGTKDFFLIERRQIWPINKCQFIKAKGEVLCYIEKNLIGQAN